MQTQENNFKQSLKKYKNNKEILKIVIENYYKYFSLNNLLSNKTNIVNKTIKDDIDNLQLYIINNLINKKYTINKYEFDDNIYDDEKESYDIDCRDTDVESFIEYFM